MYVPFPAPVGWLREVDIGGVIIERCNYKRYWQSDKEPCSRNPLRAVSYFFGSRTMRVLGAEHKTYSTLLFVSLSKIGFGPSLVGIRLREHMAKCHHIHKLSENTDKSSLLM